ncbi:MAG: DUF1905 domain-containing protein [Chloroflexi bacterium]|nr:DUF1905 domain-containing protein [Chloroflexota bacterium]
MTIQRFSAVIEKAGNRAVLRLPFDPNAVWGAKERHHISGSVNGCPVRGALGVDTDGYFLALGAAWRRDNRLDVGAEVDVELTAEGPQMEQLADDISAALEAEPEALAFFQGLATFYRKGYLRWIDGTKGRPEIRAERIAEVIDLLKSGEKQRK